MTRVAPGWALRCIDCDTRFETDPPGYSCSRCGGLLEAVREPGGPVSRTELFGRPAEGVWRFRALLPFEADVRPVSLREGGTPLVRTVNLPRELGLRNVHVKNEGQNPTGSFKDRGMTVSVTRAVQSGVRVLICASTGNTSASMSAYAARAGVTAAIIVPAGKVASGKMVQATVYGATIIRVDGTFDDALSMLLQTISSLPGFSGMNSVNPYRLEGQKTAAFEIYEQLGFSVPDYVVLPVGNAGNISAIWKGFKELRACGLTEDLPRMVGVQAEGASPIARAFWKGSDSIVPVQSPSTVASAIRIGNPASGKKALAALKESDGMVLTVSDDEIIAARGLLASREGIFVEPASAAPIAALREIGARLEKDATVVCVATGNGLKDPETIKVEIDGSPLVADRSGLMALLERVASQKLVTA
ncbi:MAG: threonine synthase [Nitrososphaerales archaeon]|jgi:threonine synthase